MAMSNSNVKLGSEKDPYESLRKEDETAIKSVDLASIYWESECECDVLEESEVTKNPLRCGGGDNVSALDQVSDFGCRAPPNSPAYKQSFVISHELNQGEQVSNDMMMAVESEPEQEMVAVKMEPEQVIPDKKRKRDDKIFCSGVNMIDDLTELLVEATSPVLTRANCQTIFKNLITFVAKNPTIALAENLFKMDQVQHVNSFNVNSMNQIRYRNWQWVLQSFSPNDQEEDHDGGIDVQELACRKSKAVQIGRLMNAQEGHARFIIGFWLHKLIQVRYPTIILAQIPRVIRSAHQDFLKWQDKQWQKRRIPFETPILFDLVSELLETKKVPTKRAGKVWHLATRYRKFWIGKDVENNMAFELCRGIGSKRLLFLYLTRSFHGTLEELNQTDYWDMQNI